MSLLPTGCFVFAVCACSTLACSSPDTADEPELGPSHAGTLRVTVYDPPSGAAEYRAYLGRADGSWLDLNLDAALLAQDPALANGAEVRVYGDLSETRLSVRHIEPVREGSPGKTGTVSQAIVTGPERTLAVVLVGSNNSFSPTEMKQRIFGEGETANSFFQENSFGYFKVVGVEDTAGDVFGPYNINLGGCNINSIADAADSAAEADGHDMSAYDHVMYYFPPNTNGCPGGGQGAQPGRETWIYGVGINSAWDYASHELGHNFGLFHAASYTGCQSPGGGCNHDEYGDPTDVMGGRNFQYSSYHKEKLTWLGEQNIDVVSASKQVRLYPMETASEGVQSARVPRGNGDFIHLEYRQPIGFDSRLESGLTDGVLVRVGPDPNPSQRGNYARLFDMKPQTNAMTDAALAPGSTFQDGSIQIATVEATSDWALVNIVIDGVEPTPIDDGGASGSGVASTTGTTTSTGGMTTGTTGATSTTAAQTTGAGGNPAVTTSAGNTVTSVGGVGGTSSTGGVTGSTMTSAGASLTSTTSATTGFVGSTTGTGVTTAAATTGTSSGTTTGSATTTTGAVGGVTTTNPGAPAAPAPAEDSGCTCSTPGDAGSARGAGGLLGICLLLGLVRRRPSKHTSKQRFPSLNN